MQVPTSNKTLLTADSVVNIALGVLLMAFPAKLVEFLGVPAATSAFYPSILGAVLFGIGIALWIGRSGNSSGLGLGGAVSINMCGGVILALWLILGNLEIPSHGQVFLWILVVFLVGLSGMELVAYFPKWGRDDAA